MKTINCVQGSPEWLNYRLGVVTASEVDAILTPLFKAKEGKGPTTYLYKKLTEKLTGAPVGEPDSPWEQSRAMAQGALMESEAVPWFNLEMEPLKITRVGLCLTDDERAGGSPDGLIGEDGGIEIKCPTAVTHVRYLLEHIVPEDYLPQIHFYMYVTGRKWWYFLSYARAFPPLLIRVERDEVIQSRISAALSAFNNRFDAALSITSNWPMAKH